MSDKFILTDIDEVVLKYHEGFERYIRNNPELLSSRGIKIPHDEHHLSLKRNIMEWLHHHDEDNIKALVDDFAMSEEFSCLEAGWESDIYFPKLIAKGYRFVGITACGSSVVTFALRMKNLSKLFNNAFLTAHCIDYRDSKKKILEGFPPSIWVEDNLKNAIYGLETGHRTFLMSDFKSQSMAPSGLTIVRSWKDIEEAL